MKTQRHGHGSIPGRGPHEKGMVLAVATMVVAAILVLALPFLTKLSAQYGTAGRDAKAVSALCLAEAGVEKAVSELNSGSWVGTEGLTTNLTMALDDFGTPGGAIVGDVDITVMPFNTVDSTRVITATGSVRHRGPSEVAKAVKVILLKQERADPSGADLYIIASWHELSASL
jgi:hypothetical protein